MGRIKEINGDLLEESTNWGYIIAICIVNIPIIILGVVLIWMPYSVLIEVDAMSYSIYGFLGGIEVALGLINLLEDMEDYHSKRRFIAELPERAEGDESENV